MKARYRVAAIAEITGDPMTMALERTPALAPRIRRARIEDAIQIARLFLISSDGMASYIWSRNARPGQVLEDVGTARYARTGTAFSSENCFLAVSGSEVLGMAHAFPMPNRTAEEIETDPVLAPYAELEDPGSFYLSGLAVDEKHRGRGIGKELMNVVERVAALRGCPRVSLICFEPNVGAIRFYRSRGYREAARRPLVPHPALRYASGDAVLLVQGV